MLIKILVLLTMLISYFTNNIEEMTEPYVDKQQVTEPEVEELGVIEDVEVNQNTNR